MNAQRQFLRRCNVVVSGDAGAGLDLSPLRITFTIKKTDGQTPNTAEITVYNMAADVAARIGKEFTSIMLQAGYANNYGIIFSGTIKQVRIGKENATDGRVVIVASDGDRAYNQAIVNATLTAGATQHEQASLAIQAMSPYGVAEGTTVPDTGVKLPRGKVLYGMARDYLRHNARNLDASWSIQDGAVQFVANTGTLPTEAVVLSSKTGLIGTPEQTDDGIKARCLLNPTIKIGGKVQINQRDIAEAALPDTNKGEPVNKPVTIQHDGLYRVLVAEFTGDTYGQEWYVDLLCIGIDDTLPANKQVKRG